MDKFRRLTYRATMSDADCDKLISDLKTALMLLNSVRILLSRDPRFTAADKEAINYKTPEELLILLADVRCSQIKAMVDAKRREREQWLLQVKREELRREDANERANRREAQFGYSSSGAEPHPSGGHTVCKRCHCFRSLTTADRIDNQFCRECESTMIRFADYRMEPIPHSDATKLLAATELWRAITTEYC